jgi:hypothetical protein
MNCDVTDPRTVLETVVPVERRGGQRMEDNAIVIPEFERDALTTVRAALVVLAWSAGLARAEIPPPPDALSKAYNAALTELRAGEDRQSIAGRLKPVVDKYPASDYARVREGEASAEPQHGFFGRARPYLG